MKVFKNAWFGRFVRKEKISADALWDAVKRAENGQIDADLGGGVIKQRIARPGKGKSKGYRTIVLFRKSEKSFFVYGFAKSELSNVGEAEEEQFNSNLHSSRHLRRLPCAAPHRTARTASSPLVCLLGVNLNAFWNKKMAKYVLALTDEQLSELVASGQFEEVA